MIWIFVFLAASSAHAWENHALPTSIALSDMSELVGAPPVIVEELDDFLRAEHVQLAKVLQDKENWARAYAENYPARPAELALVASTHSDIRARFLQAIRVNPNTKFALYLQELPGRSLQKATYLSADTVTLMPNSLPSLGHNFAMLKPGQLVAPVDVFTSATDEPDYGLDTHLWEDSGTDFGRQYKFGLQPFGNPQLEFASQAPFHMGFYHEADIVYWAVNSLTRTLPEYRIHLFFVLSRFAFQTGHPYWGWRFAGLGAHYIQDLTQPYHTTVMPGASTIKVLFYSLLDMIGIHGPKERLIQEASDRHLVIENHVYCTLFKALQNHDDNLPMVKALKSDREEKSMKYSPTYVRNVLSSESNRLADSAADAMSQIAPVSAVETSQCHVNPGPETTQTLLARLMRNFGTHTRAWVRAIRSDPNSNFKAPLPLRERSTAPARAGEGKRSNSLKPLTLDPSPTGGEGKFANP